MGGAVDQEASYSPPGRSKAGPPLPRPHSRQRLHIPYATAASMRTMRIYGTQWPGASTFQKISRVGAMRGYAKARSRGERKGRGLFRHSHLPLIADVDQLAATRG